MRNLLLFMLLFIVLFSANAEDKIITINKDTIHCKIISITEKSIRYEQTLDDYAVIGKYIFMSDVESYVRNVRNNNNNNRVQVVNNPWRFELNIGAGTMPWVSESMSKNGDSKIDYNEIENGLHLATSAHYFIKSYLGLGVQYSFFNPSMNEHENIEIEPTYPIFTSMQNNEKHYVHYVGLSAQFDNLFFKHDKIYFTQSISTGLIRYRAESVSEVLIPSSSGYPSIKINSLVQSYSWGATIGASAGYRIWPNLSLGAGINFLYADIKKVDVESYSSQQSEYKMDGMKLDNPISLSRFNFSVVLRYSI